MSRRPSGGRRSGALTALGPGPRCQAPLRTHLAEGDREDGPGLCDLLAFQIERHRRRHDHVRTVVRGVDMALIFENDVVARGAEVLAFGQYIPIPIVAG